MLEESMRAALGLAGERLATALRQKLAESSLSDSLLIELVQGRVTVTSRARDVYSSEHGIAGKAPRGLFEATARDVLPAILDEVREVMQGLIR